MPSMEEIAKKLTERLFAARGKGKKNVEIHLSRADLSDLLEEAMKLARDVVTSPEPTAPTKNLFAVNERMHLGERGYSPTQVASIRAIAIQLVESRVKKGEVNPDNDAELKKAVTTAGREALSAYNAALEFVSG